jgi:spore maturation protein CgeB
MRIVMFYQSLVSDWNHGNAHFLRGVVRELRSRAHDVTVYEPNPGWSRDNLLAAHGTAPLVAFHGAYPGMRSVLYDVDRIDLAAALDGADLVIVHEWNDHRIVRRIGEHRKAAGGYQLLFHDTHHRSVTDPAGMAAYDLRHYDGVLAFGAAVRAIYRARGWARRAWTWHEAADTALFRPGAVDAAAGAAPAGDLVWIGNWGDGERTAELHEFLIEPVRALGLDAQVYGVRYPEAARRLLADAGIRYGGWLPNFDVPATFARFRVTVHIPRRPYVERLPGIPTIRPFEALACGIPLVSTPWTDSERLFEAGRDYLVARDGAEMQRQLRRVLEDREAARALGAAGRATILARHTCAHRVDQLLGIVGELAHGVPPVAAASTTTTSTGKEVAA